MISLWLQDWKGAFLDLATQPWTRNIIQGAKYYTRSRVFGGLQHYWPTIYKSIMHFSIYILDFTQCHNSWIGWKKSNLYFSSKYLQSGNICFNCYGTMSAPPGVVGKPGHFNKPFHELILDALLRLFLFSLHCPCRPARNYSSSPITALWKLP